MTTLMQSAGWISRAGFRLAGAVVALVIFLVPPAHTQTFTVIHSFDFKEGANPAAGLVSDGSGIFYGTTEGGGHGPNAGFGTIYKLDRAGHEGVLFTFERHKPWGLQPEAPVVLDAAGNFYGTTSGGGGVHGHEFGTAYVFDQTTRQAVVLHSFPGGKDGGSPLAGLVRDANGNVYGTTISGGGTGCFGSHGCGVVFKVNPADKETRLHTFSGGPDGGNPQAGLIRDAKGNLYGTTTSGGNLSCDAPYGCGVVFKLNPKGVYSALHTFTGGTDGANPPAGLIRDASGNFYGTTVAGGANGCGTVFKLDKAGTVAPLYNFTCGTGGFDPSAALIRDSKGNLYGVTRYGGDLSCYNNSGCGVVFELSPTGVYSVLHAFAGPPDDGAVPLGSLLRDAAGNLYGTTIYGGSDVADCPNNLPPGCGVVFKIAP